ncbi:acyl carrier protein [Lentzea sp. NPDC059081]|uniref:acyl carrier protein n=1 Tax=Lentzea sp. NPDC059081 TaxID=3346719 RepID=UPI0036CFCE23
MAIVRSSAQDTVLDAVNECLVELLGITELTPDTDLVDSGVLNSLSMVGLIAKLERRFDIRIAKDDLDLANFQSPLALARLVGAKTASPSSPTD